MTIWNKSKEKNSDKNIGVLDCPDTQVTKLATTTREILKITIILELC